MGLEYDVVKGVGSGLVGLLMKCMHQVSHYYL